ncbi:MAG: hypothetical protein CMF96_08825 [Candidatus Marinimicrobia bacterium]|nr:hypothetical protein [Candidatus Neomarinimicrobiota bacterium]|tara:strand:+ start:703 stop:1545 length:843 start_codon:yes stop_codon:yes gene_type:complete
MKYIFQILFFIGFCFSGYLQPNDDPEMEILEINSKTREYFISRSNILKYTIKGPKLIVLHARKPAPKRHNGEIDISFKIHLEGTKLIQHFGKNNISKSVYSKEHPGHVYSKSEKIYINIPNGTYNLNIISDDEPILFRLTTKNKIKRTKTDSVLPSNSNNPVVITAGKKSREYSLIKSQNKVTFNSSNEKLVWLYIRGIHKNKELSPIVLNYNQPTKKQFQKVIFYSEPSLTSKSVNILGQVGKLRTFPIDFSNSFDELILENLSDIDILIRGGFIQKDE